VLEDNRGACGFYEAMGGRLIETRRDAIGAAPITERVYGWAADRLPGQEAPAD